MTRAFGYGLLASILAWSACQGTSSHPATPSPSLPPPSREENTMSTRAQQYIHAFERGEDFTPPAEGLLVAGAPDPAALAQFDQVLPRANPEVTENIVHLLVDLGLQLDPTRTQGTEVLRDADILARLVRIVAPPSRGVGREAAIEALRKLVRPADLAPSGDVFTRALEYSPSDEAFLLVAKAKPASAVSIVQQLRQAPGWTDDESAKIAAAALGDISLERAFLARLEQAEAASDGHAFADALGPLSLIGTNTALVAVAERLRTPLSIRIPGAFTKSMRLNVLEALLYNFPEEAVLYPNNIITEGDYTAAEVFCTKTLGVTYSTPPPPFMTFLGEPIPMP